MEFDIIFFSYDEPICKKNWTNLKHRFPRAQIVHVNGHISAAYRESQALVSSEHFFLVDGYCDIIDDFDLNNISVKGVLPDQIYQWKSRNDINDLVYEFQSVRLLPKSSLPCHAEHNILASHFLNFNRCGTINANMLASVTRLNHSPLVAWTAGFREGVRLQILRNILKDTQKVKLHRTTLDVWLNSKSKAPCGRHCVNGIADGSLYIGQKVPTENELTKILHLMDDKDALAERFNMRNRVASGEN